MHGSAASVRECRRSLLAVLALALAGGPGITAQTPIVAVGDSLGEGVQSADASLVSQPWACSNLLSLLAGDPLVLPYIRTWKYGQVDETTIRRRWVPTALGTNLAVSGADVGSLLRDRANATTPAEIATETELVLYPRLGSQIEIAEALDPELAVCWIGNNDALGAILAWDQLDASQLTPVAQFEADFTEIATRLDAVAERVVFANVPDVTSIGYLFDANDLTAFLGQSYGLPAGSYTSLVVVGLIRLGLDDGSLLQDPNHVLDAGEVAVIQARTTEFNAIIQRVAAARGLPVYDVAAVFRAYLTAPPSLFGVTLGRRLLRGLFSLDGVHLSNIGHALVANGFANTLNAHYGTSIPRLNLLQLAYILFTDPFLDKDGDGLATGRPEQGALETLGPLLGISGDLDDFDPGVTSTPASAAQARQWLDRYLDQRRTAAGLSAGDAAARTPADYRRALAEVFGARSR